MKATVKWAGNAMFVGESGSGHALVMDGPPDSGGRNLGPRPMEMLLLGMGGCSAFDVIHILQRGRHQIDDCTVEIEAQRADQPPKVFTHLRMHYVVSGKGLSEAAVSRAIDLSAKTYCSASIMLGKTAEITHDFEIIDSNCGNS